MHIPAASNENAVFTGNMSTGDLLALADRFDQLVAMARRIDASGTPEERYIASTKSAAFQIQLARLRHGPRQPK